MPRTVPTPLAAAIGLVPAVLGGVRALPGRVVSIPIYAVSSALSGLDATRQGYDDLAERGERLVARLRGTSFDEVEDAVEDALQGTPVAGLYDVAEDVAEDVVAGAGRALRSVGDNASTAVQNAEQAAQQTASAAADAAEALAAVSEGAAAPVAEPDAEVPAEQAPKGAPTPRAVEPETTRVDSAATPDVQQTVEQVASAAGGTVPAHDELPLGDYDHMTLGSLRGRLRSLTVEQLVQLRDYEKAHADRLPVVTMLDNRIAKLATDPAAQPTGKTDALVPELQPSQVAQGGSKVQPATGGPAQNPPSQGDPTNPSQPR